MPGYAPAKQMVFAGIHNCVYTCTNIVLVYISCIFIYLPSTYAIYLLYSYGISTVHLVYVYSIYYTCICILYTIYTYTTIYICICPYLCVGLYPTESDDYEALRDAISKLKLNVRHVYTVVLLLLQCDCYLMDI